jgi:3-isopropylmalate dehydrogenase
MNRLEGSGKRGAGGVALLDVIRERGVGPFGGSPYLIGALPGEGVGPEVVGAALKVLDAVATVGGVQFDVEFGGPIGREAESVSGAPLSHDVIEFCNSIFERGGAIMAGAGGGRFVYDLRRRFDLFCKVVPVHDEPQLAVSRRLCAHESARELILVRENVGGIYQGTWDEEIGAEGRRATHAFAYDEQQVEDILRVGARLAASGRGSMAVVWKESGIPSVSALWRDCAQAVASDLGVRCFMIDVDFAAYWLLTASESTDVLVAPNLFGDVLGDLAAVFPGSRGLTYSGNYARSGSAVYQTNHGAAYDLKGTDTANPVGQIFSAAMMLRESFELEAEARLIEHGVRSVWAEGVRTADIAEEGCWTVGTSRMTELVCRAVAESAAHMPS